MSNHAGKGGKQDYEHEQFEAYGEYTYDYLRQLGEENGEPSALPPEAAQAAAGAAVQMAKRARKRRRTHGFFKFLALLTVLTIALIVGQETLFRLETVYVIGNEEKTPQQIVAASGLVRGRNMISIEEEDVAEAIGKDHTIIFKGMQKEYPNTIYLYIEERKTVAAMQWLGILYTLDPEGIVMKEESGSDIPAGLPLITGFRVNNINVGQQLMVRSAKQLEAYRVILEELQLQMYQSQISEINLSNPENIYLVTVEGVTVRLGNASYMQAKIGAVRTDMAYLRQLGKTSGILDVTTPEDAKYMTEN
ncbi:MAG: cell division protein FtsQ/DivIB [Clostridiales bacterium]|nr:cell division protein FtsQ/DivIB [Clostridiales bacterium]